MADDADGEQKEHVIEDSVTEKSTDTFKDSSSSSDSDKEITSACSSVKGKVFRLFGREKPVHKVLGGGKPADLFLWRDKKASGCVFGAGTVIWILFEVVEYHLLTLLCHFLILAFSILFLWSNASTFINKPPPKIPQVQISDDTVIRIVSCLRFEINRALTIIRDIASGRDLKKFLSVIAGLWIVSVLGSWFNLVTLLYLGFLSLYSMPIFYEKYEDKVDSFAEKAVAELKKQYEVFDAKVLSKVPMGGASKDKKAA